MHTLRSRSDFASSRDSAQTRTRLSGGLVAHCIKTGHTLESLPLSDYKQFSDLIDEDIYEVVDLLTCVRRRTSEGGTSPASVRAQVAAAREVLK